MAPERAVAPARFRSGSSRLLLGHQGGQALPEVSQAGREHRGQEALGELKGSSWVQLVRSAREVKILQGKKRGRSQSPEAAALMERKGKNALRAASVLGQRGER